MEQSKRFTCLFYCKNKWFSDHLIPTFVLVSIVDSISACHAEDQGSIPWRGVHFFFKDAWKSLVLEALLQVLDNGLNRCNLMVNNSKNKPLQMMWCFPFSCFLTPERFYFWNCWESFDFEVIWCWTYESKWHSEFKHPATRFRWGKDFLSVDVMSTPNFCSISSWLCLAPWSVRSQLNRSMTWRTEAAQYQSNSSHQGLLAQLARVWC